MVRLERQPPDGVGINQKWWMCTANARVEVWSISDEPSATILIEN